MLLHPNQVRLNEENIEQYLFENPGDVSTECYRIARWLKRQYHVPSGIIDLLGVTTSGDIAVVELKSVEIKGDAILQVKRYAYDIEGIIQVGEVVRPRCIPILVGPSISDRTFLDCEACDVTVLTYRLALSLEIAAPRWTEDWLINRANRHEELAEDETLAECIEAIAQRKRSAFRKRGSCCEEKRAAVPVEVEL